MLYHICAGLLLLAALGHTLGGMLGTARRGPKAGPEAEHVFSLMKSVHFKWQGTDTTWFDFWLGNGMCVSAVMVNQIIGIWVLGSVGFTEIRHMLTLTDCVVCSARVALL